MLTRASITNSNALANAGPPGSADDARRALPMEKRRGFLDGVARNRALLPGLALIAATWLLLFWRLHTEWIVNELYSYGWVVPFLALYLFSERWRARPPAAEGRPHPSWLVLPAALLVAYLPMRVINEANPDWVKINFYLTCLVAAFSFGALFAIGRLRYMWHFAFPILFTFTALPWPIAIEDQLVQTLTRWNTLVSADTLTLCGVPAIATGNIIQVGSSWVNVADACSGIRSLQTAFMMSLFLGEFHRLGLLSRVLLMGSSFVVAFLLNIGRTMTLTWINAAHGGEVMESWHDHVGTAVMVSCIAGLWALSVLFARLKQKLGGRSLLSALTLGTHAPTPPAPAAASVSGNQIPAPFPAGFVVFGLAVLAAAELFTEGWYRRHEAHLDPPPQWTIDWPAHAPGFQQTEFPDRTRAILKYNEGETCSWITPEGYEFQMYYIRWHAGRVSKFLSGAHYPTVCMPATGLKYDGRAGVLDIPAGPLDIRFTNFLFDSNGAPVYVFHAIIEDRPAADTEKIDYRQVSSSERIASVLNGHRNLGQRVIGISIFGATSLQDAESAVRDQLSGMLKVTPVPRAVAALSIQQQ
ncbi:exosortase/archaeosortase family protein [Termitidicoccus mucosus]|uniref:Methanolan biosynthesis EpsI domain-containing protein n=1 Tax=Termitidicoccus mucosus TaxID=1184151 RepID=A0A178IE64_9BACT|nr:hypothetical protein AW736_23060 [Opitutaceae bacterium TSB47]